MTTITTPTIKHVQIDLYSHYGNVHMNIQNDVVVAIPLAAQIITPLKFVDVEKEVKENLLGFDAKDFSKEDSKQTKSMFSGLPSISSIFSSTSNNTASNHSMSNNILGSLGKFGSGFKNYAASSVNVPMNTFNRTGAKLGKSINLGVDKVRFEDIYKNVTEIYNDVFINGIISFDDGFKTAVEAYSIQLKEIQKTNITNFSAAFKSWFNTRYYHKYNPTNLLNSDNWNNKEMYKIYNTIHVEYTLRKNLLKTLEQLNKFIEKTATDAKTDADKTGTKQTQTYFQTWITDFKDNYKNIPSIQLYTIYKNLKTLIDHSQNGVSNFDLIDKPNLYFNKPTNDTILFKNKVTLNNIDKDDFVSQEQMYSILNYTKPFTFIYTNPTIPKWTEYITKPNIIEIYKDIIKDKYNTQEEELIHPNNIEGNMTINENDPIPGTATTKAVGKAVSKFGNAVVKAVFPTNKPPPNEEYLGGRTKKYKKLHKRRNRKTYKR